MSESFGAHDGGNALVQQQRSLTCSGTGGVGSDTANLTTPPWTVAVRSALKFLFGVIAGLLVVRRYPPI